MAAFLLFLLENVRFYVDTFSRLSMLLNGLEINVKSAKWLIKIVEDSLQCSVGTLERQKMRLGKRRVGKGYSNFL